ncbi:LuxR C-terminal-related transcriptional regulator [Marinobacterium jannaschii]|uniref:LuxR C-terminal-related transcriptional regulator n=1 Tax=Marinobacterium jannaschii TaxID=64970 RepID=UPI00047FC658|nr:LuxR C-terminal-related transcriptional regulator [Marinobacterium jannaschii]
MASDLNDIHGGQDCPPEYSANINSDQYELNQLIEKLSTMLAQAGFEGFIYSAVIRGIGIDSALFKMNQKVQGKDYLSSFPGNCIQQYYQQVAADDPAWDLLRQADIDQSYFVNYPNIGASSKVVDFWTALGIQSQVHLPLKGCHDKHWFNCFSLYHRLPANEFPACYEKLKHWLEPELKRFHCLLGGSCLGSMNPYINHEVISATCLQIMRMTAEGMAVKRIADLLALTEEGVTYHITRAKNLFKARNKTQLIALMYEVGLL